MVACSRMNRHMLGRLVFYDGRISLLQQKKMWPLCLRSCFSHHDKSPPRFTIRKAAVDWSNAVQQKDFAPLRKPRLFAISSVISSFFFSIKCGENFCYRVMSVTATVVVTCECVKRPTSWVLRGTAGRQPQGCNPYAAVKSGVAQICSWHQLQKKYSVRIPKISALPCAYAWFNQQFYGKHLQLSTLLVALLMFPVVFIL